MEDFEREEFNVCGVHYRGTREEANRIGVRVFATPEWLHYTTVNNLLTHAPGTSDATLQQWREIAAEDAAAYRAVNAVALRIVREELS